MAECTEICQMLNIIDDKYGCSNAASQEELRNVSDNVNLIYTNLSATIANCGLMH